MKEEDKAKEDVAWKNCHKNDLWIFDKLILSKKLGYVCGPKGIDVPRPDYYIIRPCINLLGMGVGAEVVHLEKSTESIPDGFFWCEVFKGRHLSIDYQNGIQKLCVEGKRSSADIMKWDSWEKVEDQIPFPKILKQFVGEYEWVNVEMIDNKIIEVHLRRNPDFLGRDTDKIVPIWSDKLCPDGYIFVSDEDGLRVGFCVKDKK